MNTLQKTKTFLQTNYQLRHAMKLMLGFPLLILAIFFIGKIIYSHWSTLYSSLAHIHYLLFLLGIICTLVYFILRSILWQLLLRQHLTYFPFLETTYLWTLAELKRYVPGNIWSVASRVMHFTNKGMEKKTAMQAYIAEAEYVVLGSFAASLFGISFIYRYLLHSKLTPGFWLVLMISLFCIVLILYIRREGMLHKLSFLLLPSTFTKRTEIFMVATAAFLFYGLGSFFFTYALFPIALNDLYIIAGFFAFCYLIGYLSFITPTGLGVREGLITYGLAGILQTSQAAFVSIFIRIMGIFTELLYFLIILYIYKSSLKTIQKIKQSIQLYPQMWILSFCVLIYISYFSLASFLRYDNFFAGRFDLGNMAQTIWNTQHGRIFVLTDPNGTNDVSRLATHADFLLILITPFYFIWSDPHMLLLLQSVILGIGAYFVYLIANKILGNKNVSLVFAIGYLLNPSVERTNLYDFHAITLATTFLLISYYFILTKRLGWFLVFGILAALSKEQVWLMVSLMGFYAGWRTKRYIFAVTFCFIFGFISYYLVTVAIPQALGSQHFALSYYSDFGDTPSSVIKNMLFSPGKTLTVLFSVDRMHYLQEIFFPVGYLSIFAPPLIFAGPEFAINLLSSNANMHQIYYQYTAAITPFLFISAIYGLSYLFRWLPKISYRIGSFFLLAIFIASAYLYGPLPGAAEANTDMFLKQLSDRQQIDDFLKRIPKHYSVAASNNLGSHLSNRQNIYTIPVGVDKADIVAFLLTDPDAQPSPAYHATLARHLRRDPKYRILYEDGPFIVFKKKSVREFSLPDLFE